MVTDADIRLSFPDMLPAGDLIRNEIEDTENPRPQPKKEISDDHGTIAKQRRQQEERQEDQHENGEHQQGPHDIQPTKDSHSKSLRMQRKAKKNEFRTAFGNGKMAHQSANNGNL